MANRVLTGARVRVVLTAKGKKTVVGLFNSIRGQMAVDVAPIPILGQYSPVDLTVVSTSEINGVLTGFRVPVVGSPFGAKKGDVSSPPATADDQIFQKMVATIRELTSSASFGQNGNFQNSNLDPNGIERTLELFDSAAPDNAPPVLVLKQLVFTGTSFDFGAKSVSTFQLPFKALVYADEVVDPSVMQELRDGIEPLGFADA